MFVSVFYMDNSRRRASVVLSSFFVTDQELHMFYFSLVRSVRVQVDIIQSVLCDVYLKDIAWSARVHIFNTTNTRNSMSKSGNHLTP